MVQLDQEMLLSGCMYQTPSSSQYLVTFSVSETTYYYLKIARRKNNKLKLKSHSKGSITLQNLNVSRSQQRQPGTMHHTRCFNMHCFNLASAKAGEALPPPFYIAKLILSYSPFFPALQSASAMCLLPQRSQIN